MPTRPSVPFRVLFSIAGGILLLATLAFWLSGETYLRLLPFLAGAGAWMVLIRHTPLLLLPTAALFFLSVRFAAAWPVLAGQGTVAWALPFGVAALAMRLWRPGLPSALGAGLLWSGVAFCLPPLLPLGLLGLPFLCRLKEGNERHVLLGALSPWVVALIALLSTRGLPMGLWETSVWDHLKDLGLAWKALFQAQALWTALPLLALLDLAQHPSREFRRTWVSLPIFGSLVSLLFLDPETAIALVLCVGLPAAGLLLTRWALALPGPVPKMVFTLGCAALAFPILWNGGTP